MNKNRNYWLIYRDDGTDDGIGTIVSKKIYSFNQAQEECAKWNRKKDGHNYFDVQHQTERCPE